MFKNGLAVFVLLLSVVATPVLSEEQGAASGPLDGMVFSGMLGPEGNLDSEDEIHFSNGKFWSKLCTKCGFQPGDYWVRKVGDVIHFRGELVSERGVFDYTGTITNGKIETKMDWTINRWYWSIERDYAFSGTLKSNENNLTATEASQVATLAMANLPSKCQ